MKKIEINKLILKDMRTGKDHTCFNMTYEMPDGGTNEEGIHDEDKFLKRLSVIMKKIEPKIMKGIS